MADNGDEAAEEDPVGKAGELGPEVEGDAESRVVTSSFAAAELDKEAAVGKAAATLEVAVETAAALVSVAQQEAAEEEELVEAAEERHEPHEPEEDGPAPPSEEAVDGPRDGIRDFPLPV